jgi:1-acyl-sn-glycerol-3-phosphate acyltransferase
MTTASASPPRTILRSSDRRAVSQSSIIARSILFNILFYLNLIVHMIVALPTLLLPHQILREFIRSYGRTSLWLLRVISRIDVEWRDLDKIPAGACIIACKHQSVWETFALYTVLREPIYILKRELMWIPLFGWYTWKAGLIPVDRSAGLSALSRMTARAQKALGLGRQLVIFPEGTRRPPGAEPVYKPGVAFLYSKAGVPCVPLALNSGLFWPRRSLRRQPGTILVQALDPIPAGLDRKVFFARLQSVLEEATARLVAESGPGIR